MRCGNADRIMIEPVALADFFLSFFTAAMIILVAVLYVALFTWSRMSGKKSLRLWALLVYLLLLACVLVFVKVMNLSGYWQFIAVLMALGYWWMPRLIWRLCTATHDDQVSH